MPNRENDYFADAEGQSATPAAAPSGIPRRADRSGTPIINEDDAVIAGGPVTEALTSSETSAEPVVSAKVIGGDNANANADTETGTETGTEADANTTTETDTEANTADAESDASAADEAAASASASKESDSAAPSEDSDDAQAAPAETEIAGRIPVTGPTPVAENAAESEEQADAATTAELPQVESAQTKAATAAQVQRKSLLNAAAAPADELPDADWQKRTDVKAPSATATLATPTSEQLDSVIFEGAKLTPVIPKRIGGRIWSLLLTLVLVPVGAYLLANYLLLYLRSDVPAGTQYLGTNWMYLLKFVGGAIVMALVILIARLSSLGAFVSGIIFTVGGLIPLIAPAPVANWLEPTISLWNVSANPIQQRLGRGLEMCIHAGQSGLLFLLGLALIMLGFVAYGTRRSGRRDMNTRSIVETDKEIAKQA